MRFDPHTYHAPQLITDIRHAVASGDSTLAKCICEFMFHRMRFTYGFAFSLVNEIAPDIDRDQFEELCQLADHPTS
jgi:hypothetical protein